MISVATASLDVAVMLAITSNSHVYSQESAIVGPERGWFCYADCVKNCTTYTTRSVPCHV